MRSTDAPPIPAFNSLVAVLATAAEELRELQARHEELTSRIRSVRSAVHALRRLSTNQRLPCEQDLNQNRSADATRTLDENLIRACRIALLETDEALSADDVHARIVRRGSFYFSNPACIRSFVALHLNALAKHGEVRRIVTRLHTKWKRV